MLQIKSMFKAIHTYHHNILGTHWDNINSANIQGAAATAVFDTYVSQKVFFFLITQISLSI